MIKEIYRSEIIDGTYNKIGIYPKVTIRCERPSEINLLCYVEFKYRNVAYLILIRLDYSFESVTYINKLEDVYKYFNKEINKMKSNKITPVEDTRIEFLKIIEND